MCVVHCTSMTSSTIVAATIDMTIKLGITLPKSIIQKIDNKRGDIPRSRYIRRAIERYLGSSSKNIDNNDNDKAIAASKKSRRKWENERH
jgi:metal-responsive CopG/Arc/MetJ family transcriptional regulator